MDSQLLATLAYYAQAAYNHGRAPLNNRLVEDLKDFNSGGQTFSAGGSLPGWEFIFGSEASGGFYNNGTSQALVAYNSVSKQIVISFRGTEGALDITSYPAILASPHLLIIPYAPLLSAVFAFAANIPGSSISVTGHSLGGVIAEAVATQHSSQISTGAFFGSPGSTIFVLSNLDDEKFVHFTRVQDSVGRIFDEAHSVETFYVDDYRFNEWEYGGDAHSSTRYINQVVTFWQSPLSNFVADQRTLTFLDDSVSNTIDLNIPPPRHNFYDVVFGSPQDDHVTFINGAVPLFLDGGGGHDVLSGGAQDDVLAGGLGSDSISGEAGNDRLYGGEGNDYLEGGVGNDSLEGGNGNDWYSVGIGQGSDTISDAGSDPLDLLRIYGGTTLTALSNLSLSVSGADLLVQGYAGSSLVLEIRISAQGSTAGQIEKLNLYAGIGDAYIGQIDLIDWWAANTQPVITDPSPPSPGAPSSVFTDGNDNVVRGNGDDVLTTRGRGIDSINLGGGQNTLVIDYSWASQAVYGNRGQGQYTFQHGNGPSDRGTVTGLTNLAFFAGSGDDIIVGLDGPDAIHGGGGNDGITGGTGGDALYGEAGDDSIDGGTGSDWIDGGSGIDRWIGDRSTEVRGITFLLNLASTSSGQTLVDGTHVANIERITLTTGSGNDLIAVSGGGQTVSTGAGDDELHFIGTTGNSSWSAGDGQDRLVADMSRQSAAVYFYAVGGVSDLLIWNPDGSVPQLNLTNVEQFIVIGGSGDDQFAGRSGNDTFTGNAGNDQLLGGAGNDVLDGGADNDTLTGGSGRDSLDGGSGIDTGILDLSDETRAVSFSGASASTSSGQTLVDGTHVANIERITLTTGSGNDLIAVSGGGQTVSTGAGDDELHFIGTTGNSSWSAGDGQDRLVADMSRQSAAVYFYAVGGVSDLLIWNPDGSVPQLNLTNVEQFIVIGGSGDDQFAGRSGNDTFTGNAGNDQLLGGAGNDVLDGGADNDTLTGGSGRDSLDGGSGIDTGILDLSDETRAVSFSGASASTSSGQTLVDGTHVANIERITLTTGSGNDLIAVSGGGQTVSTGAGDDELHFIGTTGNSSWSAGDGQDRLVADMSRQSAAVYFYAVGGVSDLLIWNPDGSVPQLNLTNVEQFIVIGGSGDDQFAGRSGNDTFTGNAGNDQLLGGAGNDVLDGGADNDTLLGDVGEDQLFGGDGVDVLRGDVGIDILSGGAGDDTLDGGNDDDFLNGGTHADMLTGGNGADRFYFAATNQGADTIIDFNSAQGDRFVVQTGAFTARNEFGGSTTLTYAGGTILVSAVAGLTLGQWNALIAGTSQQLGATNDSVVGEAGPDDIDGGAGNDRIDLRQGGSDRAFGGMGNDAIFMGAALDPTDFIDGGVGVDQIGVWGSTTAILSNVINTEFLAVLSGTSVRYGGDGSARYTYDLTSVDGMVVTGLRYIVQANELVAGENLRFDGSAESDGSFIFYTGKSDDVLIGGAQGDAFFFGDGGRFTAADKVNGRGGTTDQLGLRGDYSAGVTLLSDTMVGVETLVLLSAKDVRFGAEGASYSYNVTLHDGNVASNTVLTISANTLRSDEAATVNGAAETNGAFLFIGGAGADRFTGGAGADRLFGGLGIDTLTGGQGADQFLYRALGDSTAASRDTITDFSVGDLIDVSVLDAITGTPANDTFAFIGATAFSNVAGQLRAYQEAGSNWIVEADVDGNGIADLQMRVVTDHALVQADFVL